MQRLQFVSRDRSSSLRVQDSLSSLFKYHSTFYNVQFYEIKLTFIRSPMLNPLQYSELKIAFLSKIKSFLPQYPIKNEDYLCQNGFSAFLTMPMPIFLQPIFAIFTSKDFFSPIMPLYFLCFPLNQIDSPLACSFTTKLEGYQLKTTSSLILREAQEEKRTILFISSSQNQTYIILQFNDEVVYLFLKLTFYLFFFSLLVLTIFNYRYQKTASTFSVFTFLSLTYFLGLFSISDLVFYIICRLNYSSSFKMRCLSSYFGFYLVASSWGWTCLSLFLSSLKLPLILKLPSLIAMLNQIWLILLQKDLKMLFIQLVLNLTSLSHSAIISDISSKELEEESEDEENDASSSSS